MKEIKLDGFDITPQDIQSVFDRTKLGKSNVFIIEDVEYVKHINTDRVLIRLKLVCTTQREIWKAYKKRDVVIEVSKSEIRNRKLNILFGYDLQKSK